MTTVPMMIWPCLTSNDARGLIEFLTGVGFTATLVVPAEGPVVEHAQLNWPEGGGVMLGSAGRERNDPAERVPGTASLYVVTDDPARALARAEERGATVVQAGYRTDYGSFNVLFTDPEGNLWCFGTYRGEPA